MATRTLVRLGNPTTLTYAADATLLDVVRRVLGARAASRGCTDGQCGACRVLLDGELVNACKMAWGDVPDGATLETFEEMEADAAAVCARAAFEHERPTRCRLCVPALGVTAVALARRGLARDANAIDEALERATCMCTGRASLRRALLED